MPPVPLLATLALAALAVGPAAAADHHPLEAYRWSRRVLVVSAATADDHDLAAQRQAFAAMRAGARERDLVLVEAVGPGEPARRLRERLGLDPARFAAVLVGKDGGAKLRAARVVGPEELFPLIDAMPMRRDEMGR